MRPTKVNFKDNIHKEQLWKGGDPIALLTIQQMQVEIYLSTIGRFLYGPEYQALANTEEMDYQMELIRKIAQRKLGSEEKMEFFTQIMERITLNRKNIMWEQEAQGALPED